MERAGGRQRNKRNVSTPSPASCKNKPGLSANLLQPPRQACYAMLKNSPFKQRTATPVKGSQTRWRPRSIECLDSLPAEWLDVQGRPPGVGEGTPIQLTALQAMPFENLQSVCFTRQVGWIAALQIMFQAVPRITWTLPGP